MAKHRDQLEHATDDLASGPLIPRMDRPEVRFDPAARVHSDEQERFLAAAGVPADPRFFQLEARVGGLSFGSHYQEVVLGFRCALRQHQRSGAEPTVPRLDSGEPLLEIAIEGDTHFYVTPSLEAWVQDHIADRRPRRAAASLAGLARRMNWPIVAELLPDGASTDLLDAAERVVDTSVEPHRRLALADARARLHGCNGPVTVALALEELAGGLTVGGYQLGLDTHRAHPPRDAYDEWLSPELQRQLVQIGFGGPLKGTLWLDDDGVVHEIGPLDRLRPMAATLDECLIGLAIDVRDTPHFAVLALEPLDVHAAAAFFGAVAGGGLGAEPVVWSERARRSLEEQPWLARTHPRASVVSAPSLTDLAAPLVDFMTASPGATIVFLDAFPEPTYEVAVAEPITRGTYRIPCDPRERGFAVARDATGALRVFATG